MVTSHKKIDLLLISILSIYCTLSYAGPWFTGPLLAPTGHVVPLGHVNLEFYGNHTENDGVFNTYWKIQHTPASLTLAFNPILSYGLTDFMDAKFTLPYIYSKEENRSSSGFGDNYALIGIQLLEQKNHFWRPDLRMTIQEIFPSGTYQQLNPQNNGTDARGTGSYQTRLAFNFQHLLQLFKTHYLRTRLSLGFVFPSKVDIKGISTYRGAENTFGTIKPGDMKSIDLAAEYTLTQNWVLVMEGFALHRQATRFRGFKGRKLDGSIPAIGHGKIDYISLAPAIEYNFNEHYGLIGGVWFNIRGKNTPRFRTTMIAFNAFW